MLSDRLPKVHTARTLDGSRTYCFSVLAVQRIEGHGGQVALIVIAVDGEPHIEDASVWQTKKGAWCYPPRKPTDPPHTVDFLGEPAVQDALLADVGERLGLDLPRRLRQRERKAERAGSAASLLRAAETLRAVPLEQLVVSPIVREQIIESLESRASEKLARQAGQNA